MSPRRKGAVRQVAVTAKRGRFLVAEPMFERDRNSERITLAGGRKVGAGRIVLLDVAGGRGEVIDDLGKPDRAGDVVGALLRENGMGTGFPRKVEEEAAQAARSAEKRDTKRMDLTDLPTFTVDPASARDFDDAVSASQIDGGVRLWIHIADVAAHVRPGSALEAEAYRRATSTYVPGTVEPMLPLELSASACSLAPGVDRLAVTAEMEIGDDSEVRSASFYRSRIRSDVRLDYDQLDKIFAGREKPPGHVAEPLALARKVAAGLADRRKGSSLEVSSSEPDFEFDSEGNVVAATSVEQTESHSLIEQLMVLTNEQVAELLERKKVPTLYRVHEQPDPERIEWLLDQLAALDIPITPGSQAHLPEPGGQDRGRGEPGVREGGQEARERPRGVYIARAAVAEAGPLHRPEPRPRGAGQPRVRPLHLPDPPLPGPGRPPRAALRRGGRGGPTARRGARRGGHPLLRARARGVEARASRRRRLRGVPAPARALRARAPTLRSRER